MLQGLSWLHSKALLCARDNSSSLEWCGGRWMCYGSPPSSLQSSDCNEPISTLLLCKCSTEKDLRASINIPFAPLARGHPLVLHTRLAVWIGNSHKARSSFGICSWKELLLLQGSLGNIGKQSHVSLTVSTYIIAIIKLFQLFQNDIYRNFPLTEIFHSKTNRNVEMWDLSVKQKPSVVAFHIIVKTMTQKLFVLKNPTVRRNLESGHLSETNCIHSVSNTWVISWDVPCDNPGAWDLKY